MENQVWRPAATRREFMISTTMLAGALMLPAGLLSVTEAIAAGQIKDVPRNLTLVSVRGGTDGKHTEHELWSPYVIGSNPHGSSASQHSISRARSVAVAYRSFASRAIAFEHTAFSPFETSVFRSTAEAGGPAIKSFNTEIAD